MNNEVIDPKTNEVVEGKVLGPLRLSLTTISGKFEGLYIKPEYVNDYELFGNVISAESTIAKINNLNIESEEKPKINNRGRKKLIVKKQENKKMRSQIQFIIKSTVLPNKVYKIKCFNTETFQVPGVRNCDYSDVMPALIELKKLHEYNLGIDDIKIKNITPIMQNYICKNIYDDKIDIKKLKTALGKYIAENGDYSKIIKMLGNAGYTDKQLSIISKYVPKNRMGIKYIKHNMENYNGTMIIVERHSAIVRKKWKDEKTSIKLLQSGKVNFDSVKCVEHVIVLYKWLDEFYSTHYNDIVR